MISRLIPAILFASILCSCTPTEFSNDRALTDFVHDTDNGLKKTEEINHQLRAHTYRQTIRHYDPDDDEYIKDIIPLPTQKTFNNTPVNFRFINDFSNRYQYTPDTLHRNKTNQNNVPLSFEFSTAPTSGDNGTNGVVNNHLVGSKFIRHFTNFEIKNGATGFIETKTTGFNRTTTPNEQLGGFQIVNESGVTYHFSLPAYSREEFQYSEDRSDVTTYNYSYKPEQYAYTWYLTAITGPDYVDRGASGPSEEDWGYWVELEYGKWSDWYMWRNPGETSQHDLDEKFRNFSEGIKEVYYLDAVRTKTHTALFVKNIRKDAKSALRVLKKETKVTQSGKTSVKHSLLSANRNGGFIPKAIAAERLAKAPILLKTHDIEYVAKPVSSLKLDKIVLIENTNLAVENINKTTGNVLHQSIEIKTTPFGGGSASYQTIDHHLPDNVLDSADINGTLASKALRVIKFNSDTETLCPETPNSFHHSSLEGSSVASTTTANYALAGKLALNSIEFLGKGAVSTLPPVTFSYDLSTPVTGNSSLTLITTRQSSFKRYNLSNAGTLALGDIIRFTISGTDHYASVIKTGATAIVQIIGKNQPSLSTSFSWVTTKNAPYNKENHDQWGMYKADYFDINNPRIDRIRTRASKNHVDVWSLREIGTSLGSKIRMTYESDSYQRAELSGSYPLVITSASFSGTPTITFGADAESGEYFFENNSSIRILTLYEEYRYFGDIPNPKPDRLPSDPPCVTGSGYVTYGTREFDGYVTGINGNQVTVSGPCLGFFGTTYEDNNGDIPDCTASGGGGEESISAFNEYPPGGEPGPNGCPRGYVTRYFLHGNILIYNPDIDLPGGDLRTTSVSIEDAFTDRGSKTEYSYEDITKPGQMSGVTSYAPAMMDKYHPDVDELDDAGSHAVENFRKHLYNSFSTLISKTSEVPAPGVLYEYVTVSEAVKNTGEQQFNQLPFKSTYHFRVFEREMVSFDEATINTGNLITQLDLSSQNGYDLTLNNTYKSVKNVTIKDFTTQVGELLSVTLYDNANNRISETINHYLTDGLTYQQFENALSTKFNNQGRVDETFVDSRAVGIDMDDTESDGFGVKASITQRQRFPSVAIGQTTINYKTGVRTTSEDVAFDFYSGAKTKTRTTDGHGNTYQTEVVPAYKTYGAMGLAANGGKNMLTQEAATYTYKIDAVNNNPIGLVSAGIQTWSNQIPVLNEGSQTGIWRKHATFSFIGDDATGLGTDGLYPMPSHTLPAFNAWNRGDDTPLKWQRNAELTLYDVYSHALEASDLNNQFAATKMSADQTAIYATVANAMYEEFCYSGAEDRAFINGKAGGNVGIHGSRVSTAHTGSYGLSATAGTKAFSYVMTPPKIRTYKVSVWASQGNTTAIRYKLNNVQQANPAVSVIGQAGSWYLLEASIPVSTSSTALEIWCEAVGSTTVYDDFRIRPLDAAMSSYVYNQWNELSHILDNNNLYTRFEYDASGRLTTTYRETLKRGADTYGNGGITKVSEVIYNHGNNN